MDLGKRAVSTHLDALAVVVDVSVDKDLDFGESAALVAEVAGHHPGARIVDPVAEPPFLQ